MTEENAKVRLSDRDRLIEVIEARWEHLVDVGTEVTPHIVASLIADDILGSRWKVERDVTMLARGKDAGYEKGLRDAIAAVGDVDRCDYETDANGEARLIRYEDGQRAIARLSAHGMEAVFDEKEKEVAREHRN
jgi:hypothetical protein